MADSDIHQSPAAIGRDRGLNVEVSEPDISAPAILEAATEHATPRLLDERIRDLRYFGFVETELNGVRQTSARGNERAMLAQFVTAHVT